MGALYGCESSPVSEQALAKYRTAVADTITKTTSKRSSNLTFSSSSEGPDIDPDVEVVCRRVKALRRYLVKEERAKKERAREEEGKSKKCAMRTPPHIYTHLQMNSSIRENLLPHTHTVTEQY